MKNVTSARIFCGLLLLLCSLASFVPAAQPVNIGANINYESYWSSNGMWANVFNSFSQFFDGPHNAQGYPIGARGRAIFVYTHGTLPGGVSKKDTTCDPANYYRLSYRTNSQESGQYGHITFALNHLGFMYAPGAAGVPAYDKATQTWTAKMIFVDDESWDTQFTCFISYDPAGLKDGVAIDPITDMKLIRPDCADTDIFSPEFLKRIRPFTSIRAMDWLGTNGFSAHQLAAPGTGADNPGSGLYFAAAASSVNGGGLAFSEKQYYHGNVPINPVGEKVNAHRHGISCMAPAQLRFTLNKHFRFFSSFFGIDQAATGAPIATFEVWGDDKLLWSSGEMTKTTPAKQAKLDLLPYTMLTFKVSGDASGNTADYADIAEPIMWMSLNWEDRPLYKYATQCGTNCAPTGSDLDGDAIAPEYLIQLANAAHVDPWINIPINASDDYIRGLATVVLHGNDYTPALAPARHVYIEYGNEVWNWGNPFGNGCNYAVLVGSLHGRGFHQQYADRAKEISDLFRQVFGAQKDRVRMVLGGQCSWTDPGEQELAYIKTTYGDPAQYFYGYAVAPYIHWGKLPVTAATTLDQFMPAVKQDMEQTVSSWIYTSKRLADAYHLKLVAYEGGTEFYDWDKVSRKLFSAAMDDPRMGDIYEELFHTWQQAGGDVFVQFTHITRDYRWALLTSGMQVGTVRWDSVMRESQRAGDTNFDGIVDLDDFHTLQANFGHQAAWWMQGDFNGDRVVDMADFWLLYGNLGALQKNPEMTAFAKAHANPVLLQHYDPAVGAFPHCWPGLPATIQVPVDDSYHEGPANHTHLYQLADNPIASDQVTDPPTPPTRGPRHGTVDLTKYPAVTYTPAADFVGDDDFRISVTDQTTGLLSNIVTLPIHVKPWNATATFPANNIADAPKPLTAKSPNGVNGWTYLYAFGTPGDEANSTAVAQAQLMHIGHPFGGAMVYTADDGNCSIRTGCDFDSSRTNPLDAHRQLTPIMQYLNPTVAGPVHLRLHLTGDEQNAPTAGTVLVGCYVNDTLLTPQPWSFPRGTGSPLIDQTVDLDTSAGFSMREGDAIYLRLWTADGNGDWVGVTIDATISLPTPK